MEENNDVPSQEVQEPAEQIVQNEEPVQAPKEEQPDEASAPAEAVKEPEAAEPQKDYEPSFELSDFMQKPAEQPQFTPDDEGFIDPGAFYNKVLQDAEARIEQKMQFQEAERKAWNYIENKYPEIKEDPELREMVNAQRLADVARGGKGDLTQVASKVLGKLQSYQSKGKAQAQVSEKVQKSAALQQTTANNVDTSKDSDLMERMSRGDESAKEQLITEWLEQGKL